MVVGIGRHTAIKLTGMVHRANLSLAYEYLSASVGAIPAPYSSLSLIISCQFALKCYRSAQIPPHVIQVGGGPRLAKVSRHTAR